jgi:hypothetical protein
MNKQRFTRADGTRGAVSQTRQMPALRLGFWWVNRASLGAGFNHWVEVPTPVPKAR